MCGCDGGVVVVVERVCAAAMMVWFRLWWRGSVQLQGVPVQRTHFAHALFVLNQERYVFRFASVQNFSAWDRNKKKRPQSRSGTSTHEVHAKELRMRGWVELNP